MTPDDLLGRQATFSPAFARAYAVAPVIYQLRLYYPLDVRTLVPAHYVLVHRSERRHDRVKVSVDQLHSLVSSGQLIIQ